MIAFLVFKVFAGYFVEKSMYSPNYIVVGRGATHAIADWGDLVSGFKHLTSALQGVHLVVLFDLEALCKARIQNSLELN